MKNRQAHLDLVRILAILLVLFNHTGSAGFFRFAETGNPVLRWCYLLLAIGSKTGVPLFFMVSGALLLNRQETLAQLYRCRVLRVTLALILFSLLQYAYNTAFHGAPFSLADFFRTLYGGEATLAYWFLYAYLAALVMLPLLRPMAAGMSTRTYWYFFGLFLGFRCLLPLGEELLFAGGLHLNAYFSLPLTASISVVYMLLGHFLNNVLPVRALTRRRVLLLCLAALAGMVVSGLMTLHQARLTGVLDELSSQNWFESFTPLAAAGIFCLLRRAFAHGQGSPGLRGLLAQLSDCTFGLYLLHVMLMDLLRGVRYYLEGVIYTFPACLVYVICVAGAGYVVTYLLRRIPAVRRLL